MSFLDFRLKPLVVQRQLQAFSAWDKNANLRDALDRKDLLGAHGAATAVLARRLRERQGPEPPVSLPYPKDSGAYRQTFLLDPYDDIYYALLASSAAPSVQRGLPGSDVVLSTRFLPQAGGVFAAEDWRAANRRRGIVDRSGRLPFGGLDVQDQYLTTSPGVVVTALNTCQTPTFVVEEVVAFLEGLSSWPTGPIGLAAGPMASALFGTVSLLPVDRLLARLGVTYERWVDDIVIQCLGESHFETTVEAVDTQLRYRNQSLNRDKTWFEDAREAPLASQWADTSFDNSDDEVSLAALERAVEEANAPRCRFILGGLKWKHDTSAVPFVVHNDDAWRLAPKHSGDYLAASYKSLTDEQLEEMTDRCARPPQQNTAAAIAHGGRVLGKRRVPGTLGRYLFDAADRASTGEFRAISPMLYLASSVSKERPKHRHERAICTAAAVQDLNSQRGLIAGLKYDTRPRAVERGLDMLSRTRRDLAPTIEWVRAPS